MSRLPPLRASEWIAGVFFAYVAVIAALPPRGLMLPAILAGAVWLLIAALAYGEWRANGELFSILRDWVPLALTLAAYREMNLFTPSVRDYHFEFRWIEWDRVALDQWGGRRAIEWWGPLLPGYLETCYMLVYAVGPFAAAAMYLANRRDRADRAVALYLLGTLLAYAMFPYFPSDPPRVVFGGADLPAISTPVRAFNLRIVNGYGIHSSVFPSAHVSSAFAAAWALLLFLPERKWVGRGMLIYAISVAIAVIYGRYHYAVDSLAGFGVSFAALIAGRLMRNRWPRIHTRAAGRRPA